LTASADATNDLPMPANG